MNSLIVTCLILFIAAICWYVYVMQTSINKIRKDKFGKQFSSSKESLAQGKKESALEVIHDTVSDENDQRLLTLISKKLFSLNIHDNFKSEEDVEIEIKNNLAQYFEILIRVINRTKETLIILDYIEHGKQLEIINNNPIPMTSFYEEYYKIIESLILNNKNINYIRVLELPMTRPDNLGYKEAIIYAIDHLYSPTRKHIGNLINCSNFKLYVINDAIRGHSEVIVDEKYWFNELDRYHQRKARPDSLFLNVDTESLEIARAIRLEKKLICDTIGNIKCLSAQDLASAVAELKIEISKEISQKEKEAAEIAEDFPQVG